MRPARSARLPSLLLAGGLACDALPTRDASASADPPAKHADPPVLSPAAAAPRRYVALMKAGVACAPVVDWSARPLFLATSGAREAWGVAEVRTPKLDAIGMPAPLRRFCVYTWAGLGSPTGAPVVPSAVRVDADPDVVVPQGGGSKPVARSQAVLQALGAVPQPGRGTSPYGRAEGLPYVAIVDTADSRGPGSPTPPSYTTAPAQHQHGLMMAWLVDAVRCPLREAQCTSRQFLAQAFPYDATSVEPLPSGGQRGSLGSLAAALGEALARWRSQPDAASSPLVINMSLGWDLRHGGELPLDHDALLDPDVPVESVPAPVQAVHNALAWAACEGALSLAAAGNARGALCEEQGTMAPAAWEGLPAPSLAACALLGVTPLDPTVAKLAYGVGGLDEGDRPIAISRLGSMPSRGLHSMRATVAIDGGAHSQPWTGTSVATAALSAIVAQAWSYQPSVRPAALVDLVDASGTVTAIDPRWLGPAAGPAASLRRIDAHAVLHAIAPADNPYAARTIGGPTTAATHVQLIAPTSLQPVTLAPAAHAAAACGSMAVQAFSTPGSTGASSPGQSGVGPLSDETRPQPHVPICPNCPVIRTVTSTTGSSGTASLASVIDYTLYIEIDARHASATIDQPALSFYDPASNTTLSAELGPLVSTPTAIALQRYALPSGSTLAAWLEAHPQVSAGRLTMRVSGVAVTEVVDIVRQP